jgi:hypothetical protein
MEQKVQPSEIEQMFTPSENQDYFHFHTEFFSFLFFFFGGGGIRDS